MEQKNKNLYIQQNASQLSQQGGFISLDGAIDYINYVMIQDTNITIENPFFESFDDSIEYNLINDNSVKDYLIIKEQDGSLTLKESNLETKIENIKIDFIYNGYGSEISSGYPKFYYDDINQITDIVKISENKYSITFPNKDFGIYKYYILATNEIYQKYVSQPYKTQVKNIIFTARPKNFKNNNINLENSRKYYSTNVDFSWSCNTGVDGDQLSSDIYIGTSKDNMEKLSQETCEISKYTNGQSNTFELILNNTNYYFAPGTQYFWKVEVKNQYGVKVESEIFDFITTGEKVSKLFNAPNPFNPMKEKTKLYFNMPADGSVDITVYSEYGDKIFSTTQDNIKQGTGYYTYDGKDDRGNTLYNGTYLCIVNKKYNNTNKSERCRLLIIK